MSAANVAVMVTVEGATQEATFFILTGQNIGANYVYGEYLA